MLVNVVFTVAILMNAGAIVFDAWLFSAVIKAGGPIWAGFVAVSCLGLHTVCMYTLREERKGRLARRL